MATSQQQKPQALQRIDGKALAQMDPMQLGEVFSQSGMFQDAADPAKAIVKIIAGRELGIGPMASMTGIHMIEGKPSLSANLLAAQVKKHEVYDYIVREHSQVACSIEFFQNQESIGTSEFTLEDAARAGVAERSNWKRYPKAMLFARALSQGVRWHCPDVTAGTPTYVPEELGVDVDGEGTPVEVAGQPSAEVVEVDPEPTQEDESDGLATDDQIKQIGKALKATGLGFERLKLLVGSTGGEAPKINRSDSIIKALRVLDEDQAEKLLLLLNREADRGE